MGWKDILTGTLLPLGVSLLQSKYGGGAGTSRPGTGFTSGGVGYDPYRHDPVWGSSTGIPGLTKVGFGGLATARGYVPNGGGGYVEHVTVRGRRCKRVSPTTGKCIRRMNPANIRAGRRAIRRIKSLRKVLKSIESQLPRRAAASGRRRRPCR